MWFSGTFCSKFPMLITDPRLVAFITHGGLGSVNEVSYLGKPAILCPIFADQMRNAQMLTRHNGSIQINKNDLGNTEKIENAIMTILQNDSFRKNSEKLARLLEKQPVKPRELLLKYAEFAAEFGKIPALDPFSRRMPFYQYFLLDVILITVGVGILMVWMTWKVVKWCLVEKKKQKIH